MEAAEPIMTPSKIIETKFLNLNLIFNNINYECCFYELNEKIKIDIMVDKVKYENIINFNEFKNLNKYFRMFDNLKELEQDLIGLSNSKKIEIINVSENEILLCINVLTLDNNKTIIQLKKTELKDKELINLLFKEIENIKNENKEIKKENEEIKRKLNELNIKSIEQEKIIKENKKEIAILHKLVDDINKKLNEFSNNKKEEKEKLVITKNSTCKVAKYLKYKLGFSDKTIESIDLDGESLFSLENYDVNELDELTNEEKIKLKYLINEIKKHN